MSLPDSLPPALAALVLLPFFLMLATTVCALTLRGPVQRLWTVLKTACLIASLAALVNLGWLWAVIAGSDAATARSLLPGLAAGLLGAWLALLVQGLGAVIASFSARYLDGEAGQVRYVAALSAVLAAVHLLVLADHWVVLIAAWSAAGFALHRLLCFYGDRPFATLAAHKKFLADRLADVLLVCAAVLATQAVGSGSLSVLFEHVAAQGASPRLQLAAVLLGLAVLIRTAMLPVHGWLIQVMEAPTPVSALLHAGVVNLGGFVLIRFAPLFEQSPAARNMLVIVGLITAMLAGFVMLTRISIKVRLAWSTLAQMGFMVLECGLGLYELAVLHLIGHSLYKAHAFLAAGEAVRTSRLRELHSTGVPAVWSLLTAPLLALALLAALSVGVAQLSFAAWPWWWSAVLALAWAPMLWVRTSAPLDAGLSLLAGSLMLLVLAAMAFAGHALPLGVTSVAHDTVQGLVVLAGMTLIYLGTAALQVSAWRHHLEPLRRQSYAGFYLDEAYTRLALRLWPVRLPATLESHNNAASRPAALPAAPL